MKIKYLTFKGLGQFRKNIENKPGLIIVGHVGLQFEDDPIIYGFHPTPEAEEGGFSEGQYNCSTFPMLLGIKVPSESGLIKRVISNMKEAQPWKL